MHWTRWILAILIVINAGWMVYDGSRALLLGDYTTAQSAELGGQLGPWADVVTIFGVDPRSTGMKLTFLLYGVVTLGMLVFYLQKRDWAWTGLLMMLLLGIWYAPIGTLINLLTSGMLFLPSLRRQDVV